MSRSQQTEITNPAVRWYEWSGSEGKVKYYDRETKENVFIDLPFTFLILDVLTTITGYSDEFESGFYANEVRNLKTEELVVRTKKGIAGRGLYDEVKHLNGAKYTASVYIAFKGDNGLELGNIKLSGSAIGPFIEFRKGKNIFEGAVAITKAQAEKKGATKYFSPVFEVKPTSEETNAQAIKLDEQLQEYLKAYFSRDAVQEKAVAVGENPADYLHEPEMPELSDAELEPVDTTDIPF